MASPVVHYSLAEGNRLFQGPQAPLIMSTHITNMSRTQGKQKNGLAIGSHSEDDINVSEVMTTTKTRENHLLAKAESSGMPDVPGWITDGSDQEHAPCDPELPLASLLDVENVITDNEKIASYRGTWP